jgi:DNA-binding MarR family transcriptional regulator
MSSDADVRKLPQPLATPAVLLAMRGRDAQRVLTAAHARAGLKPRQVHAIVLLAEYGGMTQRELGEAMMVDPSVLVGLLNPLEQEGLISREREATDRRRHNILLTPTGQDRLAEVERQQAAAEDAYFAELDPAEREQLRQLLARAGAQLDGIETDDDSESDEPC